MILSILIPSLVTRREMRSRIEGQLRQQCASRSDVEIIVHENAGEKTVGELRNECVALAGGEYIVFVDDDDLVSRDYVQKALTAIESKPDCVGFRMLRYVDGVRIGDGVQSLAIKTNDVKFDADGTAHYLRMPMHTNAIRSDIVRRCPFPAKNFSEDHDFGHAINPSLKREVMIDDPIYFYLYRTPPLRAGEMSNAERFEA